MGRIPDLPCDIEQVVDLLGIEVIRDTGTQLHCRCPFCADRKAHLNVKIRDNVFRCNRCGKGGGILHLYAEFCDVSLHILPTQALSGLRVGLFETVLP